jgi:ribosomal protein S18 acetylase RimI-like enzyme
MDTLTDTITWVESVQIRHICRADLPALEWDGEFSRYRRVYLTEFERSLNGTSVLWVAEKPDTGIIGQVFVQLNAERQELANGNSRAYLYAFRIQPAFQNSGLGTRMMRVVETNLARRNFRWITLNVGKTNYSARRLYCRLGYRVVAHEAGKWSYVDENGALQIVVEPAWRMEKFIFQAS